MYFNNKTNTLLLFRILLTWAFCTLCHATFGQGNILLPVRDQGQWGVVDANGKTIIPLQYDAISQFQYFGHAIVQQQGKVGLIDSLGRWVFEVEYDDIRVLSPTLFGIADQGQWHLMNQQDHILISGYDKVKMLGHQFIQFWRDGACGVVDLNGCTIVPAQYESLEWDAEHDFFIVHKNNKKGLYHTNGQWLADAKFRSFEFVHPQLILTKEKYKWSGITTEGGEVFPDDFSDYELSHHDYLLLYRQDKCYLYSIAQQQFVGEEHQHSFLPLNPNWIAYQKYKKMGLMDAHGKLHLPPSFQEILPYGNNGKFRVAKENKWGVITHDGKHLAPIIYDYISPWEAGVAIAKKDGQYGIMGADGQLLTNTIYDHIKIEAAAQRLVAFKGKKRTVYRITDQGIQAQSKLRQFNRITIKKRQRKPKEEDYQLEKFEWFYDAARQKWGLRDKSDGTLRIPAQYDYVEIHREHGLSVAGVRHTITQEFGHFPIRFQRHFHLVDHQTGRQSSEERFRAIRWSDFEQGLPRARVILENGRHGLVDTTGKIICQGYAYIGAFHEGQAAMSLQGSLSSTAQPSSLSLGKMQDYLKGFPASYIIGDFGNIPDRWSWLSCEDCAWGYIDTLGRLTVPPIYEAASDFCQGAGIVRANGRWGMLNHKGDTLLPFHYAKITPFCGKGQVFHIETHCDKYGLVDSVGNLVSHSRFDEIRPAAEGLMAFRQGRHWGFMDEEGRIRIPAQFSRAEDFHEGKAAVLSEGKWGCVDEQGNWVIAPKYARIGHFSNGLAWVRTSKGFGYINAKGQFAIPPQFTKAYDFEQNVARVQVGRKIRLIYKDGSWASPHTFDDLSAFDENGIAVARGGKKRNIYYYLVNQKGEKVGRHHFRRIFPYSEGMAAVRKKRHYGFVDLNGKIVIPLTFDKVSQFSEGMAWVKVDGQCGYIDTTGAYVVNPAFSKCKDFEDGVAVVHVNAREGGLVDKGGEFILRPQTNQLITFSEGKGLVKNHQEFYFIRESGEVYQGYYDAAKGFQNGTAFVEIDGAWGIINNKGVALVSPKYDAIERMGGGLNKVKLSRLHGIVQPNGQFIVPTTYEHVQLIHHRIIKVEQGGQIGYMDLEGNWLWDLH